MEFDLLPYIQNIIDGISFTERVNVDKVRSESEDSQFPSLCSFWGVSYTRTMKLFEEDIQEYIQLVQKHYGKDIDVLIARKEFQLLMQTVAGLYLPKNVQKLFEI